uniref:Mitochondrial import inner membrane translocase subunit n=1 Tax=Anopheles merus TaxID=30066 RepID=A0A182UYQ7_ANOME
MDYELRNIKDFLQLYNKITDMCFNSCVDNLFGRDLTREEESPAVQMVAEPMEQSNVHKVDIILRKLVSKKISEAKDSMAATKQNLQSYAKVLQERKKYVLEQIRTRELDVAEEMMNNIVEDLF